MSYSVSLKSVKIQLNINVNKFQFMFTLDIIHNSLKLWISYRTYNNRSSCHTSSSSTECFSHSRLLVLNNYNFIRSFGIRFQWGLSWRWTRSRRSSRSMCWWRMSSCCWSEKKMIINLLTIADPIATPPAVAAIWPIKDGPCGCIIAGWAGAGAGAGAGGALAGTDGL